MNREDNARLQVTVKAVLLLLIVVDLGMITVAAARYPALFSQLGARMFVAEPAAALVCYAIALLYLTSPSGGLKGPILTASVLFGLVSGAVEIGNIGIENGIPFSVRGPALQIASMLTIFTVWGIAAGRTARTHNSIRAGLLAAVSSAGICMLLAVTAGFVMQLFLIPPQPAYVAIWAEFKRSGWTDAKAFGLANALDSGFTHLALAPVVALFFGSIASLLVRALPLKHVGSAR